MNKKALAKRQRKGLRLRRHPEQALQSRVDIPSAKLGLLRTGLLCLWLLFTAAYTFIWCGSNMQFWRTGDSMLAEHATVVREPYWADALTKTPNPGVENAGWTIDVRVADFPLVLPIPLADFDPAGKFLTPDRPRAADKYSVGAELPIWFLADARRFPPASIASQNDLPVVLFNRAIWPKSPSFLEAIHRATGEQSLVMYLLIIVFCYLPFCVSPFCIIKDVHEWSRGTRIKVLLTCGGSIAALMAIGYANVRGPTDADYQADTFTVAAAPTYTDTLTERSDIRVVERHWQVAGRLKKIDHTLLAVPVEQIDPRRAPWASRFAPDLAQFIPGATIDVWVDPAVYSGTWARTSRANSAEGALPTVPWSVVSRERWPRQRSFIDYVVQSRYAIGGVVSLLFLLGIALVPLRRKDV